VPGLTSSESGTAGLHEAAKTGEVPTPNAAAQMAVARNRRENMMTPVSDIVSMSFFQSHSIGIPL
jgi:hypothetical protein